MTPRRITLRPTMLLILMIKVWSSETLTCGPEEYQTGNQCCPMCPPGSTIKLECTEFRSTSCLLCKNGTYMDKSNGHTQCFPCTNCDTGSGLKTKWLCTTTSDTVCEPLEGFFCVDFMGDQCAAAQEHTICQPGQYIQEEGTAFTDTVCFDCSDGTFSNGTYCYPHTQCESKNLQLIAPGTASADSICGEKTPNVISIIIVGVVILLVLSGGLLMYCVKKKKRHPDRTSKKRGDISKEENEAEIENVLPL
ncbi:tumor necrosis factor receptor superfamily member 14-like [Mugil cephalus]|uniref:tumor necrosis factor receptor superfamily member 14-like n=1 Tax=Mugil cephalus TaxID=48193 RepID=UPI001FB6350B|nr:tumor necrosis factor receptor superfamily member 14-like [Mugil cephalus]